MRNKQKIIWLSLESYHYQDQEDQDASHYQHNIKLNIEVMMTI